MDRLLMSLLILVVSALPFAAAQPLETPLEEHYSGTAMHPDGASRPVLIGVSLFDDGFAYVTVQLPAERRTLAGSGTLRDGTALRATLRDLVDPDPWWAVETARLQAAGELPPPDGPPAAVLTVQRPFDFMSEGERLDGTLRLADGSPLSVMAVRFSAEVRRSLEHGRVTSAVVYPRFPGRPELEALLEAALEPAFEGFWREGLALQDEGALGWAWWREERVDLSGAAGRYVSLLATVDLYTGGAHPNAWHDSFLLDLAEVRDVELAELFVDDSWLTTVAGLVLDDLSRQEAAWVVQGEVTELGPDDLGAFTLSATGLTFHFSPYAMGPYVQGSFRVTLPFEEIAHLARPDGPLRAFVDGAPLRR